MDPLFYDETTPGPPLIQSDAVTEDIKRAGKRPPCCQACAGSAGILVPMVSTKECIQLGNGPLPGWYLGLVCPRCARRVLVEVDPGVAEMPLEWEG